MILGTLKILSLMSSLLSNTLRKVFMRLPYTFATILNKKKANPICVKLIMGHKIKDITAGIYTHKNLDDLIETINLLD